MDQSLPERFLQAVSGDDHACQRNVNGEVGRAIGPGRPALRRTRARFTAVFGMSVLAGRVEVSREESAWNTVAIGIHWATQGIRNVAAIEIHAVTPRCQAGFLLEP